MKYFIVPFAIVMVLVGYASYVSESKAREIAIAKRNQMEEQAELIALQAHFLPLCKRVGGSVKCHYPEKDNGGAQFEGGIP